MSSLKYMGDSLMQSVRDFRDDSGSTTVEFVLWVPMFLVILALIVDVSLMFQRQSNLWQVARDTARQVSIGQLSSVANAETYAEAAATFSGDVPDVEVTIDTTNQFTQVIISVSIDDVGVFGILGVASDAELVASVVHRLEPT